MLTKLDHLIKSVTPVRENFTSDRQRCLEGSNPCCEETNKFDLLKKLKKPTKRADQKEISKGQVKSKRRLILSSISLVMGSFWVVESPFCLRKPFKTNDKNQLPAKGLL